MTIFLEKNIKNKQKRERKRTESKTFSRNKKKTTASGFGLFRYANQILQKQIRKEKGKPEKAEKLPILGASWDC